MQNNKTNTLLKFSILFTLGILGIFIFSKYNIGIPCLFFELTHLYCPGCGITRTIVSLFKLQFYQAFRYNMLITVLLPFGIGYWIYTYMLKGTKKIPNYVWIILLIVTIIFGVLRNTNTFSWLAPTVI